MATNGNGNGGKYLKMEAEEHKTLLRDPKFRAALAKKRSDTGARKAMGKR